MQHPIRNAADYAANDALIAERIEFIRAAMLASKATSSDAALDWLHELVETDFEFGEALVRKSCLDAAVAAFGHILPS